MKSSIITTTADSISSGGTITGDLTISGDLTVEGSSTYSYTEAISGTGTAKANFDILTLTNAVNAADMDGTETSILFNQYYYDGSTPAVADAGRISIGTETDWTSTASTQDSYMAFETALNGTVTEYMRITSAGNVGIGVTAPDQKVIIGATGGVVMNIISDTDANSADNDALLKFSTDGATESASSQKGTIGYDQGDDIFTMGYGDNPKHLNINSSGNATFTGIVNVSGAGLKITGANAAHLANALVLGYEGSSKSQIRAYGADGSTKGTLEFNMSESDGGESIVMLLDGNSRISLSNNDGNTSNTVFGKNALTNAGTVLGDVGADGNVAIGESAMGTGTTLVAVNNTAVGRNALEDITTGDGNVALGAYSMLQMQTGLSNVAIGGNDAVTEAALETSTAAGQCVAIGTGALGGAVVTTAANGTVSVGYKSLFALTTGAGNTAIGYSSMNDIVTGQHNTAVGYASHQGNIDGDYNVCIGSNAMGNMYGAELNNNIAIGFEALYGEGSATCDDTIAIGHQALKEITSGGHNTAIGYRSMLKLTTGAENVAIGKLAMEEADGGESYNVAIGFHAMGDVDHDDSDANVAIGGSALTGGDAAVKNCVAIGYNALDHTAGNAQDGTIAIGKDALTALTSGASNTAIGYYAGRVHTSGGGNTILGHGAFSDTDAGSNSKASANNTAIGVNAMGGTWANAQTDNCVAIGHSVMTGALSDVDGTVAIGASALAALTSGDGNVAVGYQALAEHTTGANCIAIGHGAMNETAGTSASTSGNNIAIGTNSMGGDWSDTGSEGNVAIGNDTLSAVLAGVQTSIALGHSALAAATSGDSNTAIGWSAGAGVTTGHSNVILGRGACNDTVVLADGTANIVIGMNSRTSATDSANQIVIGHDISGTGDNDFAFGKASNVVHNDFDTDAAWSRTSDVRLKTSINNAVLGLDFVNDLRPVTYKWKSTQDLDESDSQLSKLLPKDVLDEGGKVVQAKNTVEHMNTDTIMHGLIAQEVKEALDKAGVDTFKGWSQDDDGVQNISREMFIIPLIKAVQELSAKVEALEKK